MRKLLLGLTALVAMNATGVSAADVQASATYTETTVAMTGGWVKVWGGSGSPGKIILSDRAGVGCAWSLNSSPTANEGVAISGSGAPGSYVFDAPVPTNPVYVQCPSGATLTLVIS